MLQAGIRSLRIGCGIRPFLRTGGFRKTQVLSTGNISNNQGVAGCEVFGSGATVGIVSSGDVNSTVIGNGASSANSNATVIGNGASGAGASSVAIGTSSSASSSNTTAVGRAATATAAAGTALGEAATCGSSNGTALGMSANTGTANNVLAIGTSATVGNSATGAVAIGTSATVAASNVGSIAIGHSATTTASGQFVVSSTDNSITDLYFGNGVTNSAPANYVMHGVGGSGSNIAGGNVTIAGGIGTGTGSGGSVVIQTAAVTTTGSTAGTLRAALTVDTNLLFTLADTANIAVGSTTGTKIGTATSQKLAFFNSSPIVQPSGSIVTALGNLGLVSSPILSSAAGRSVAAVAAVASVATFTVGAADGSFLVSANVLVTAAVTANFTVTVAYTDESNTTRTLTLNFSSLTGTFLTAITNVTGTGPYEGVQMHIRCKASTTITIATTGTFTSVTYNVDGTITQIA